mgnify:CR=1 FL=1
MQDCGWASLVYNLGLKIYKKNHKQENARNKILDSTIEKKHQPTLDSSEFELGRSSVEMHLGELDPSLQQLLINP